jgi:hypothetical protein
MNVPAGVLEAVSWYIHDGGAGYKHRRAQGAYPVRVLEPVRS